MARTYLTGVVGLGFLVAVVGCSAQSGAVDDAAASGDDMSQTEGDTEAFASLHVGASSGGELAPASLSGGSLHVLGAGAPAFAAKLSPAGCVTETNDQAQHKATYVYNDCAGPLGLLHLSGTVDVLYSSSGPDNLTLDFSASNFEINQATLSSWTATAVVTASGDQRSMAWTAQLAGTTGRGRAFSRTNQKDISWTASTDPLCVSVAGTSAGTVSGRDLKTTFISYERCQAECPAAGSEVQIEDVTNGDDVDVKYEGGDAANVTLAARGKSASINLTLACGS